MSITFPTKAELLQRFLAWYRVFFPNTSTAARSDAWLEGQAVSGVAGIIMARAKAIYADMFITTAGDEALDVHASIWLPADKRRVAAKGTTSGSVTFTGTATAIPANTELVHADGTRYRTVSAVAAGDWTPGVPDDSVVVAVVSVDTGVIANKGAGDTLTLVSPISGVDNDVTVATALSGATDRELADELRARMLAWLQNPPGGGNWAHYMNFAQGQGGCTKAYVYPLYRGLGTVDVVCLGPGRSDDDPTGDRFNVDEDEVYEYLDEQMRPCTADLDTLPSAGGTGVDVATEQAQDVAVNISPAPDYEGDWAGTFTVTGIDLATKKVITVTADPAALTPLTDRILINVQVGTVWVPCVRVVDHVVTGPPHEIHVTEALPGDTHDAAAGGLKPAGAGTADQVDAILELFDGLTPGDTTPATRRPVSSPTHPTDLLVSEIVRVLKNLSSSVSDVSVATPAANVAPAAAKRLIRNGKVYITYV